MWTAVDIAGFVEPGRDGEAELCLKIPKQLYWDIKKKKCKAVELRINDGRYITEQQRKKIYATFRDIAEYTGFTPEETKQNMKCEHVRRTGGEYLSLANCSMTQAKEFINTLLDFCLYHGVQLDEFITDRTDDIDHALYSCLKYKKCAICGQKGEVHHWDAIGMGNDRTTIDDRWHRKICLCRKHHTLAHSLGNQRFARKYHVYGIIFNGKEGENDDGLKQDSWGGFTGTV